MRRFWCRHQWGGWCRVVNELPANVVGDTKRSHFWLLIARNIPQHARFCQKCGKMQIGRPK